MMNTLANFHFIRPGWLLLLPLAAGFWWLWQRRSDPLRGWSEQMDPALLKALVVGRDSRHSRSSLWLLAGWLLTIVAIAGPAWRLAPSPFANDAAPLMILLKANSSMETTDLPPTRLERAQLKIADLTEMRKGQPLGLIVYAGSAHLVLPPTEDTPVVADMASEISPDIMPVSGDRLDLALQEAARILGEYPQGGHVVVMADSVDTDPDLLQPLRRSLPFAVQFLAVNIPESSEYVSLHTAARTLRAPVESIDVEDGDIAGIVRRAKGSTGMQGAEQSGQWQEAGYWLVPLLGAIVLLSFRRKEYGSARP